MKRLIDGSLTVLLICIFLFSAYKIYDYIRETQESSHVTKELIEDAVSDQLTASSSDLADSAEAKEAPPISVDFNALKEKNKDIIAWIYCEDTPINYPVAQSKNNSDYLHRLLDGRYNANGTLFLDYRCKADFTDYNSIIYGHNMKSDAMFGTLPEYTKQSYYEEHPVMWLLTPEKNYKIELFAGFITPSDSESYMMIYEESELEQYIQEVLQKSTFTGNVKLDNVERIITLSTCSYEYKGARYVVLGKLE